MSFLPPPSQQNYQQQPQTQQQQQQQYPHHNYAGPHYHVPLTNQQSYPPNYFQSNIKQIYETPRVLSNQTSDNFIHGYQQQQPH